MTTVRRRHLLALALAAPLALAGCGARRTVALPGWDRVIVGDLSLVVRSQWAHGPVDVGIGVFTDAWREDGDNQHLLAVGPVGATDVQEAMVTGLDALRAAVPGLRPTTDSAVSSRDGLTIACLDLATERNELATGRLWAVESAGACAVVLLGARRLDESVRTTVEESLTLSIAHAGPDAPDGWTRVGRGPAGLHVPSTWAAVGALRASQRWTAGWGDVEADGAARALAVLCHAAAETSASDAMAQIEADCVAGAVTGFERTGAVEALTLDPEGLDALRLPFTYRLRAGRSARGTGVLWTLQRSRQEAAPLVCAVLATVAEGVDTTLLTTMEEGLWLAAED